MESSVMGTFTVRPREPAEFTALTARAATLTLIELLAPPRFAGNVAVIVAGPPTVVPLTWKIAEDDPAGMTTLAGIVKMVEFVDANVTVTLLVCG